jgi:hypothetical protein
MKYLNDSAVLNWGTNVPYQALGLFLPEIVKGIGFNDFIANLMTVPVYLFGTLSFFTVAYFSDRTQHRSSFIAG